MTFKQMKLIDKYLGWMLCTFLTNIDGAYKIVLKNKNIKSSPNNNILIIKFWGMGSILLATPFLKAIRENYKDTNICFLTLTRNKELVESFNLVDEVITLDVDGGWLRSFQGIVSLLHLLIREKFDIVFDLEFFTRFSAMVSYITGASVRVGFHAWEAWRGDLHTVRVPFNRYWHMVDNFCSLASAVNIKQVDYTLVRPRIADEDKSFVSEILKSHNFGINDSYICVHVNASDLALERRWPYENFIELITNILKRHSIKIIFIGTKSEYNSIESILKFVKNSNIVNLAGQLNIRRLAYLFENAKLLIANDSGPLHLASAIGTRTISFFGPETPVLYGPRGEGHIVFFKNINCSPCINVHEGKTVKCYRDRLRCMELITVQEVIDVVNKIL